MAGGIPIHPGFVRGSRSQSELELLPDAMMTLDMLDKLLAIGQPEGSASDHPYTCPMGEAAPPLEGLGLPPFLVGAAELDRLQDTNLEYYEAMKKARKDVEYLNKIAVDNDSTTAQRM